MADQVQVIGAEQVAADTVAWQATVLPTVERASESLQASLQAQLAGAVPYLTGTLSSSASISHVSEGDPNFVFALQLGQDVPYARWIEFGGSRGRELVPEGRYVYPTAMSGEGRFDAIAEQATQQSIDQYHWSTPAG